MLDRQRAEEYGIGDRKQRGVEADPDGQRGHRHERERGAFPEPAQRVTNIRSQEIDQEESIIIRA